ncbi:metallophosphoesterase [Crenothrix sp.]|uniref:metallophosphoesterase n=1 Tax=Crenothrix sp. TaxID=3100433 RepID=UPI00374DAABD
MNYDIIGDIHGQAEKLANLLKKMGYCKNNNGVWCHSERQVVFLGDFIDRGQHQLATVKIARDMVDAGAALAILGNHELNAIAWHTPHPKREGEFLRPRPPHKSGDKNRHQHEAFLNEVEHLPEIHKDIIDWFLTLPLWLDLPGIRVVHACWHQKYMDCLKPYLAPDFSVPRALLFDVTNESDNSKEENAKPSLFEAVETLCKGIEVELPPGHFFLDKDGVKRTHTRVRWWDKSALTYRQAAILPDTEREKLPDSLIPEHTRINFPVDKPLFFGHYWMTGEPSLLSENVACLDYSAGKGGSLVAYRWDGETKLDNSKFIF